MMATEATPEILATSSTLSDHDLNATETSSQDVTSEQPLVNGTSITNTDKDETKQDTEHVEADVNSAEVSVSGGSDTEASKAETSKTQTDEKGHIRTASIVKKIASFKPVSVNKKFLAAKGATPTVPSKLGDKGPATATTPAGPSTSTAPRPRLVAKSGSGLRDSAPRASTAANGNKAGAAPDASAVWNKNRPAPPPEPKRFTDEELKQRYGIHLATRLQTDEGGKEKNWADIDDDDDDWAPTTLEWTDGTKITLPQADEAPPPVPEPIPAPIPVLKDVKPAEISKPKSPAPAQPTASPTVKPSGFGSGRTGLVLKGASEKPTLVAKPPGPPTPVKSPWAPLPPVDKVAPVALDLPQTQQPQQSRFGQRDPHSFQAMPPPAKEIAADDFSRSSWRDGNSNTSRELYNSQSGRYEPVNDNSRGSVRGDAHSRQPAVLQRPSQDGGPAEPSAAFQTHRASGQDGSYGRRRTSSNVSGGSGNFVRRMSRGGHEMPPPHEMLSVRRGSLAAVSDAPSSPRNFSPSGQQQQGQRGFQNQQWQSHASPVVSHQSPQSVHNQVVPPISAPADDQSAPNSAILSEDQVFEEQKKSMRKKREEAIKRRQEEEAKEEAARKERIRIKLEAMGPAPDSKKNKKEASKEDKPVPTQIQSREEPKTIASATNADVPDGGESTVNISGPVHDSTLKTNSTSTSTSTSTSDSKPSANLRPNGIGQGDQGLSTPSTTAAQQSSHNNKPAHPWQSNSGSNSDRYNWAPPPAQQSSSNVWGPPPTNNRALGNGAFNPELGRLPDMHSTRPAPIGPPNLNRGNYHFSQGRGSEFSRDRPAPIGPPRYEDPMEKDRRIAKASPWANAATIIEGNDNAYREEVEIKEARRRELEAKGEAPEFIQPVFNDSWTEAKVQNNSRVVGKVQTNILDASGQKDSAWRASQSTASDTQAASAFADDQNIAQHHQLDAVANAQQPPFNDTWKAAPGMNGPSQVPRGSRFFPTQDVRLEEHGAFDRPGSPSPPPPTMAGHPAYDGDSLHPHVSLPRPQQPIPVVKLPPTLAPIGPPKPASFAAAVTAPAVPIINNAGRQDHSSRADSRQDNRSNTNWQDRINTLVGRKNSPPKPHAFAVDSSSKNALELPQSQFAATVSLPSLSSGNSTPDDDPTVSKPAAEECFEEQEMGSLPAIKFPTAAPPAAWSLAPPQPKTLPKKFLASQVTSGETIAFSENAMNNRTTLIVKMSAADDPKIVSFARQRSNPRRGGARGVSSRHSSSAHPRGSRGRDTSRGFQSPNPENGTSSSSPSSFGRSGRGRGSGGHAPRPSWDTHVAPAIHT